MIRYPKYRESGAQWMGSIPEHWNVSKLVWLLEHITTGLNPRANFKFIENGDYYYVTIANFKDGQLFLDEKCDRIDEAAWNVIQKRSDLQVGDILFASISKDGQAYVVSEFPSNWNINESVFKLRFKKDVIMPRFAYYILTNEAYYNELRKNATGSTFQSIKQNKLKLSSIPVPPLAEQNAIAEYLDDKTAKIDECIKLLELQKLDILKFHDAVISETITLGLDRQVNLKDSGLRFVGMIPRDWEVKQIKNVATFHNGDRGVNYPSGNDLVDSGVPFLTSNNLHQLILDVDNAGCKFITRERYDILGGAKIQINDIVYCLRGSVGNCSLNKQLTEGTVASSLMVIRPTDIVPEYLNYLLHSDIIKNQTNVNMNGTCAANLSADNVSRYKIPVPPVSEQKDIVDSLNKKTAKIDEAIRRIDEQINDLRAYRTALISEVVSGKIDVRNN